MLVVNPDASGLQLGCIRVTTWMHPGYNLDACGFQLILVCIRIGIRDMRVIKFVFYRILTKPPLFIIDYTAGCQPGCYALERQSSLGEVIPGGNPHRDVICV